MIDGTIFVFSLLSRYSGIRFGLSFKFKTTYVGLLLDVIKIKKGIITDFSAKHFKQMLCYCYAIIFNIIHKVITFLLKTLKWCNS